MSEPPVLSTLRRAARKYVKAVAARDAAMSELVGAIRTADGSGVPRSLIVRESGLARQTVYDALHDGDGDGAGAGGQA